MSLAGKTLFITGASRGIGLAIALRCARDGANIAIAAKSVTEDPRLPGTIVNAAAQIEQAGGKALPIACDIRFEDQVLAAARACAQRFGGIATPGELGTGERREVASDVRAPVAQAGDGDPQWTFGRHAAGSV